MVKGRVPQYFGARWRSIFGGFDERRLPVGERIKNQRRHRRSRQRDCARHRRRTVPPQPPVGVSSRLLAGVPRSLESRWLAPSKELKVTRFLSLSLHLSLLTAPPPQPCSLWKRRCRFFGRKLSQTPFILAHSCAARPGPRPPPVSVGPLKITRSDVKEVQQKSETTSDRNIDSRNKRIHNLESRFTYTK